MKEKHKILNPLVFFRYFSNSAVNLASYFISKAKDSVYRSVIGTALYGEIPSSRNIIHTVKKASPEKDLFGFSAMQPQTIVKNEIHKLSKQYLIFSDSRQEAAHFAVYFDITYHTLLR